MTAPQIYFLMLVVATTVLASRYNKHESDDTVGIPPWRAPRSYRSPESDGTRGIPPWGSRIKRSKTRYGTAYSLGHDSARSSFQKLKSPVIHSVRSVELSAESQPKIARSEGQDCARSHFQRGPIACDVCSVKQYVESQLMKRNHLSYLPPVMIPFQGSYEPGQHKFRQFEARGLTTKNSRKFAMRAEGSTARPRHDEDSLLVATKILSALHSFDNEKTIGDTFEHEEESGDTYEHDQDDCNSSEHEEEACNSSEHEEESGDTSEYEEESGYTIEHEGESDDEYEDLVEKIDIEHAAHVTPPDDFHLDWPVVKECRDRMKYIYSIDTQGFYLNSWDLPENVIIDPRTGEKLSKTFTWAEARNQCRKRCMDLISFETSSELGFYSSVFDASNLPFVWTSGRICDYKECANRPELKPLHLNGWFWTATGVRLPPTNEKPPQWSFQPWSPSGISNDPQPDNAEFAINGKNESCLALMNNVYGYKIAYHDVACYHKKYFTCEDSPALIDLVYREHGIKLIRPHTDVNEIL